MRFLRAVATGAGIVAACAASACSGTADTQGTPNTPDTLDIYFIDVEGGKATLVVSPAGESLLLDAGFPGPGGFDGTPGAPDQARDAQRILRAARDAGISKIDHLFISHYHADHFGGVIELAQLLPIVEFIDHAAPSAETESRVPGTLALYEAYAALRDSGQHVAAHAGDHMTLQDVTIDVIASDGVVLSSPLSDGGAGNDACTSGGVRAQETTENPLSTAIRLQFGSFTYLDAGDLSGPPLYALTCPINLVGRADVYAIAHHGGEDGSDPSLFAAVQPRVAVFSNGTRKGAQAATFTTLRKLGIAGWQLHRTENPGVENMPNAQIANLDTTTSAWIKLSANRDGSFSMTNGRTNQSVSYPRR